MSSPVEWIKVVGKPSYNPAGILTITNGGRLEFKLPTNEVILSVPVALTIRKYEDGANRMYIGAGKRLYRFQFYGDRLPTVVGGWPSGTPNENAFVEVWRPALEETAKQPADAKEIITVAYAASMKSALRPALVLAIASMVIVVPLLFMLPLPRNSVAFSLGSIGLFLLLLISLGVSWRQNRRLMQPMAADIIKTSPEAILPAGTKPSTIYPSNAGKIFLVAFVTVVVALAMLYFVAITALR